jgi:hypothetical protein
MSTLRLLLSLALSTFLSLNLSCSKLAPPEGALAVKSCDRAGRCAAEPLLEAGVILVLLLVLDSGRRGGRRVRVPLEDP